MEQLFIKDDIEPFSFNLTETLERNIRDQLWIKLTKNSQSAFFKINSFFPLRTFV